MIDHCSEELEVAVFGEVVSVLGLGIGLGLGLGGGDGHHGWTLIGEEALLVLKIGNRSCCYLCSNTQPLEEAQGTVPAMLELLRYNACDVCQYYFDTSL